MKNSKFTHYIETLVRLSVITFLIIAAETRQQYSYYILLRWLVMTSSIYFTYKAYNKKQIGLSICFLATTILFNPFQKFWFQKETWHILDYLIAFILLGTIIYDWTRKKQ